MAGIQNRTAAELKAELTAAIAQSRAMLGESESVVEQQTFADEEELDRLTGLELNFDDPVAIDGPDWDVESIDFQNLSDADLERLLNETQPDPQPQPQLSLLAELKEEVAKNPLPWALGALTLGTFGARALFQSDNSMKNPRQNASQSGNSPITHGSLMGQIMKSGFEMVQPALQEAVQGWLTRFVEKKP